jgi:hypothetical protein
LLSLTEVGHREPTKVRLWEPKQVGLWEPLTEVGHWRPAIPLGTSGSLAALFLYAVEQELM